MKIIKLCIYLLTLCTIARLSNAQECISDDNEQPCCNGQISTDPRPGMAINTERPSMINHFNWMSDLYNVYLPNSFAISGGPMPLGNPYLTNHSYLQEINYFNFSPEDQVKDNIDFHPEDGWELIHKYNGYEVDEVTYLSNRELPGPHYILYNRYSGKLRIFTALSDREGNDQVVTILSFHLPNSNFKPSGLLSYNGEFAYPLDQETKRLSVSQGSSFPIMDFFTAQFPMAYDPCVCHNRSTLHIDYTGTDRVDLLLQGRLIGTSVPIDDSGHDPLLNGRDFLTQVTTNSNFSINGGTVTYSNIDKLVDMWKAPPPLDFVQELGIGLVKAAMMGTTGWVDKTISGIVDRNLSYGLNHAYLKITGDTTKLKVNTGIGVVSDLSRQLLGSWFPDRPRVPNINFLEAEMAMTGPIVDRDPLYGTDFKIAVPGSKDTQNPTFVPDAIYPSYNEALGVFALLKTPKVRFVYDPQWENLVSDEWGLQIQGDRKGKFYFQLDDDLKYAFNPAADVDIDKSSIHVSLIIKNDAIEKNSPGSGVNVSPNWRKVDDLVGVSSDGVPAYETPSYPLGCIKDAYFSIEDATRDYLVWQDFVPPYTNKAYVKLTMEIVSKKNRYGKVHRELHIITYPANLQQAEFGYQFSNSAGSIPVNRVIPVNAHYTTSQVVEAWNTISFEGNVIVDPGVTVTFRAGTGIAVTDQSLFSNEQVKLEIGNPTICENVPPQTISQVKNFCQGSLYKANQVDDEQMIKMIESESEPIKIVSNSSIGEPIPNPATSYLTVPYDISEEGNVRLSLFSSLGEKVLELINEPNHPRGLYQRKVNVDKLPTGVYHITLQVGASTFTKNIVVSH